MVYFLILVNLLVIGFGLFSLYRITSLNQKIDKASKTRIPSLIYLNEVQNETANLRMLELLLLIETSTEKKEQHEVKIKEKFSFIKKKLIAYESLPLSSKEQNLLKQFETEWQNYQDIHQKYIAANSKDLLLNDSYQSYRKLTKYLQSVLAISRSRAQALSRSSDGEFSTSGTVIIVSLCMISFLLVVLSILSIRTIMNPLTETIHIIEKISIGDLSAQVEVERKDEFGVMLLAVQNMIQKWLSILSTIKLSSKTIRISSVDLQEHSQQLADSAGNMASLAEESAASIEELTSSLDMVNQKIEKQTDSIENIDGRIQNMNHSLTKVAVTVDTLNTTSTAASEKAFHAEQFIGEATESIHQIRTSSQKINEIVKLISRISTQTNLLSINAAIEAERAGEAGQGFSVVAESIAKLAEETSHGVRQIQTLIQTTEDSIQTGTERVDEVAVALKTIVESVQEIDSSVKQVRNMTGEQSSATSEIARNMQRISGFSKEIKIASSEQKLAVEEINTNIGSVTTFSQSISKLSGNLQSISDEFMQESKSMDNALKFFKTREEK